MFSKDFFQEIRRVEELLPTDSYITRESVDDMCVQYTELGLVFHDPPTGLRHVFINRARDLLQRCDYGSTEGHATGIDGWKPD